MELVLGIIIFIVVLFYNLYNQKNEELEKNISPFFYGEVKLVEQQYETAKYMVVSTGLKIDILNAEHIRLVQDQMNLPYTFFVIAPISAIKYIEGSIPKELIQNKSAKEYLDLRKKHHGV